MAHVPPVRMGHKAVINLRKHGVSFEEAATVFGDPLSSTFADPRHSDVEPRFVAIGASDRGRLIVVMFVEQESPDLEADPSGTMRIISARRATPTECRSYEEAI